ncbi:Arylsulfatase [Arcticibacter svalbardensis MN12-7]|uniref:Arylsulfatase n=1 Tax=Arcticibacter svalbardensis MN12-7 TaxID=1150600 RepID=R9GXW4_9SPHI|nr:arylsulfatase [Arcticibacter svalbardensis]EOR93809.1 Arylsulfatase [Arcticibacter svalbardensis MN12-7]
MKIYKFLIIFTVVFAFSSFSEKDYAQVKNAKPNIVIIYLDDLGYGDLSCYGSLGLNTPNIDKIANGGLRFTNAYASSSTCTPSRYALLTGSYPWRNKDAKILPGTAPLLISAEQQTLPKMLKSQGYTTGIVGKWHLGLGNGEIDWNQHISPGPNEVGFDFSYIMAATQDRVPTVYIKNGDVVGLGKNDPIQVNYNKNFAGEPTGKDNPELTRMKWHHGHNNSIINEIPRIGYVKGGKSANWQDTTMSDHFLNEAENYIKNNKVKPFFLYYAMQQPHVPRTPNPRFVGKSGLGPRGDVILEADWTIGELMKTLTNEDVLDNTLVIFSSDNGPVLNDGYDDEAVEKLGVHKPAGVLKGGKYSLYEGGVRIPFMIYWKNKVKHGVSDALVCQLDLLNSLAQLTGASQINTDSNNLLEAILGKSDEGRNALVIEANTKTALRKGDWLMIPPYAGPAILEPVQIEVGNSPDYQLFNLKTDLGQYQNLAKSNPEKLKEMISTYETLRGKKNKN